MYKVLSYSLRSSIISWWFNHIQRSGRTTASKQSLFIFSTLSCMQLCPFPTIQILQYAHLPGYIRGSWLWTCNIWLLWLTGRSSQYETSNSWMERQINGLLGEDETWKLRIRHSWKKKLVSHTAILIRMSSLQLRGWRILP